MFEIMLRQREHKLENQLEFFLVEICFALNIFLSFAVTCQHAFRRFFVIDDHLNYLQKLG